MSDATGDGIGARIAAVDGRWYKLLFYTLLLVWLAYMMVTAIPWKWTDKLFPFMIGIPTAILIGVQLLRVGSPETFDRIFPDIVTGGEEDEDEEMSGLQERISGATESDRTRARPQQIGMGLRMASWTVALVILMWIIGFANSLLVWTFAFGLRFFDSAKQSAIITVVFFIAVYAFFVFTLGVQPWDGSLPIPSVLEFLPG